jgi:hypothetical protein
MSDSNLASRQSDIVSNGDRDNARSRTVKPGHLEVGEFIYYEPSKKIAKRILEDERP